MQIRGRRSLTTVDAHGVRGSYDRPCGRSGRACGRSLVLAGGASLELEDLLDELRSRASLARRSQDRLSQLLDAVVAVSADLDLAEVLGRIVESAAALVDARYGALGVISADGERLVEFVTRGLSDEERARIGDPAAWSWRVGTVDPRPAAAPSWTSPPILTRTGSRRTILRCAPFLARRYGSATEVFGNLYMAEKQGAESFSRRGRAILVALAAAAGVAIDNARFTTPAGASVTGRTSSPRSHRSSWNVRTRSPPSAWSRVASWRLSRASAAFVATVDEAGALRVRADSRTRRPTRGR